MPRYRKVHAEAMTRPVKRNTPGRSLSPEQRSLVRRMKAIKDETVVYEAVLGAHERPPTLRQQLLRAAKLAGVEIAVKRSPTGFYFGLLTPERRSNRGRGPAASRAQG